MHGRVITEQVTDRLSGEEVSALKFAAHRQLARWAKKEQLSPHQRAQRDALARAARILGARRGFTAAGCGLLARNDDA